MASAELRAQLDDAILAFTLGDHDQALELLRNVVTSNPAAAEAWLALAEVHFSQRDFDAALSAADKAVALEPEDVHIHTTLSRIWMERGDKAKAEHHGAQARMLSWKAELREPPGNPSGGIQA